MSRIGKRPVEVPAGVKVAVQPTQCLVEGPKGKVTVNLHPLVVVKSEEGGKRIVVERKAETREARAMHGTMRALIASAVKGTAEGYEKRLEIVGVGYNAKMQGASVVLTLGYSHTVTMTPPPGVTVSTPSATMVQVNGADKHAVGQFAAQVRSKRPPEPYNLKGIKYSDEVVRRKAGKTFVSGA
ncbi:MAG: 50S ribosomal protein L6 [Planctomycetes bacterium]|nr:50S ribosomal protein L6 [Planctomycetota bacterium]